MGQKYGQHFLQDQAVLARIADAVFSLQQKFDSSLLWEIGPGQGALTQLIIGNFPKVILYEIDTTLQKYLKILQQSHQDLEIVRGDILEYKPKNTELIMADRPVLVGNLPYYITSPIFRKFFEQEQFPGGVFLIQKEVAQKLQTEATKRSYLWWLLNARYQIDIHFIVGPSAFRPPPKVDSAVISFRQIDPKLSNSLFDQMKVFLDIISGLKRKTLGKIAKLRTEKLSEAGITIPDELSTKRLEQLTREEMKNIIQK